MTKLNIRTVADGDLGYLPELCWQAICYWNYPSDYAKAWFRALNIETEVREASMAFVAVDKKGVVVGFSALNLTPPPAYLEHIYIEPEAMGKGIGQALMAHTLGAARKNDADAVELLSEPKATGFYESIGGKLIGETESQIIPGRMLPRYRFELG